MKTQNSKLKTQIDKSKTKISVVVIAKNEEKRIGECLDSVKWADEIIVVDDSSIDKTEDIAIKHGARVVNLQKGSFSDRRNLGAKGASGVWLLYIDADELVTPALRKELKSKIQNPKSKFNAYAIPRRNILLGHEMKHGGWWPDYVLRLIRYESLNGWKGDLHEQPEIEGNVGKLNKPLIHNSHRSLTEMVEKTNDWSEIEAKLMFEANHPQMNLSRFATAMFREFWYRAIIKKGFLDGPIGIIEIIYQVFSRFVSYAKLWEMQLESEKLKVKS